MHYLTVFLAINLLVLSMLPCTDNETGIPPKRSVSVFSQEAGHEHESHDHHQETCSPLCACQCCATAITFIQLDYTLTEPDKVLGDPKVAIWQNFYSFFHHAIWQPPKIS